MPGQNFRSFTERVALVTGGAHGIGRAVALQLALEGAYVIANYAPGDREGESVANELRGIGTLAHTVEADVSRAAEVGRMFRVVEETFGRLDLLINSASITRDAPLAELTEEAWDEVVNVSLKGAFLCSQAAVRLMHRRPAPAMVNITSEVAFTGRTGAANYVAAQAGVIGLTKALARELAPRIRVNCVAVGETKTDKVMARDKAFSVEDNTVEERGISLRHVPAPNEVARACVFLLSSDANSITGQTLVVGGSWL